MKPDYKNSMQGRSYGRDHGGDSERLSDQIFAATAVQAKVYLHNGTVKLSTKDMADYYVARTFLVNDRGLARENIVRAV